MEKMNLQLFSVKQALKADFKGTLKKVSDIGYDGVEFCGYYGNMTGSELQSYLDFTGLNAVSAHIMVDEIEDDEKFRMHADILSKCGCLYMINPWAKPENADEAKRLGERLEKAAEKCAKEGFYYGYHTHGYEIEKKDSDGVSFFDNMMEQTELCLPELDVYWIKHAGADIDTYLRRYAGRINLLHLKQMKDVATKQITSLDDGIIDFAAVIKEAKKFGTEHFIIEQDSPTIDELTDAQNSFQHIEMLKF